MASRTLPLTPAGDTTVDLLVIGSGPSGQRAAISQSSRRCSLSSTRGAATRMAQIAARKISRHSSHSGKPSWSCATSSPAVPRPDENTHGRCHNSRISNDQSGNE